MNLFGIPVIDHTLQRLNGFDIVLVYHYPEIAEYIKTHYPDIELIYNPNPERGNGYSLYLARKAIDGDFLLFMSDHYFGDKFFKQIEEPFDETTVFVSRVSFDDDEATKIQVHNENVINIGKQISEYDFFDTGLFYCKNEIFEYLNRLVKRDKVEVSHVMTELAKDGKLRFHVVNDFWIDIDTPAALKKAEKYIEKMLQKGEDGYIAKYINRKISVKLTKRLARIRSLTPNHLTVVSLIFGVISAAFFFLGNVILGGIFTQITSTIDGCDGELARIKNLRTKFGAVFDSISDRYVDIFIVLSVFWAYGMNIVSAIAFFLAVTGSIFNSYSWHQTKIRVRFGSRDVRLFAIMIGSILSYFSMEFLLGTLFFIGIATHLAVVKSLLELRKKEAERVYRIKTKLKVKPKEVLVHKIAKIELPELESETDDLHEK